MQKQARKERLKMVDPKLLGAKIRWARRAANLTQAQLADLTGLARSNSVSEMERGAYVPSLSVLDSIADATDVSPWWFLQDPKKDTLENMVAMIRLADRLFKPCEQHAMLLAS